MRKGDCPVAGAEGETAGDVGLDTGVDGLKLVVSEVWEGSAGTLVRFPFLAISEKLCAAVHGLLWI